MSDKKADIQVFACTDADLAPWVLPFDPKSRHTPTAEETALLQTMHEAFRALMKLGWNAAMYAPCDGTTFLAIEAGSTGVHECTRDEQRRFWTYDGDVWPSQPILWKSKVQP